MSTRTLVSSVTCPHCWAEFPPAQVRFVAEHAALQGDPVLGESAAMRFLPSRFDARGRAIDPLGATASRMACMRCHLEIPAAALELPQAIVSIVGAPATLVTLGSELKMAASGPAGQRIHRQRGVRGKSKSRVVTVDDQALKSQVTVKSGGLPARGGAKAEGGRGLGWGGSRCGRPR